MNPPAKREVKMAFSKINTAFIRALVIRDIKRYFSNPTGYVFITLFIFLSAAAAFWQDRFFRDNLANLDQLNSLFPLLLLAFIPALTMSVWAEERKQATDELLFTLPATSLEVVLGKYLAVLSVYTVALVLSFSHVLVLFWLGSPDIGVLFANYLAYWLIGGAMISAGLLASALTSNSAIAFILGAVFCSAFVFLRSMAEIAGEWFAGFVAPLGIHNSFNDLASGVISFSALVYFISAAGVFLFINTLLIDSRHWPLYLEGRPTKLHYFIRVASVLLILISLNIMISRWGFRLDVTSEHLHSLNDETGVLLDELTDERPVFVQAFISPDVPETYVQTRANLLGILREIDASGGQSVQVLINQTEPFTEEARDAREKFGIMPRKITDFGNARSSTVDVFLGLAFTCGAEEMVIPFLDRGLSPEYEIARSIRVVAKSERRKIGVFQTGINLFGGMDYQTMQSTPPWSVVMELRKQYEIVQLTEAQEIPEDLDGLLVALPSSMPQPGMDKLAPLIKSGIPTLLLVDPMPAVDINQAPSEQAGANMNPFDRSQQTQPPPKGNINRFMADIGVSWDSGKIIWDNYNPHPDMAQMPPEIVFVGTGNQTKETFNPDHPSSSQLQETVFIYPGHLNMAAEGDVDFTPLIKTSVSSGRLDYQQLVQRSFFGIQLNPNLPHRPDDSGYILAAQIRSKNSAPPESPGENETAVEIESETGKGLNLIVIADLDFISEQFFQIRERSPGNLIFDNVTFFLNCIDVLVGDESFISLRNKRMAHRTLERVENQTRAFINQRLEEEEQAEADADRALKEAQERLDQKVAEVRERPDLDERTQEIMARNLQEVENRRFEVLKTNIETARDAKIASSMETMEDQIRRIENTIKTFAVLIPPIPVFVLGVFIFIRRRRKEKEGAAAARRFRG
jgi:gliding motility-associated transport system permease protein/gliding motility-associatede transport system auxiliary component